MPLFKRSIFLLMHHHINNHKGNLVTISPYDFERQIQFIASKGYNTVFMQDVIDFLNGKADLPPKSIALTFDDGYLDNWVYAYPILKRYNIKATIFIVTSWMSEGEGCRPNTDSVASGPQLPGIPSHSDSKRMIKENRCEGTIMNWKELMCMQESGVIDIQSHTHLHTDINKLDKDSLKENLYRSKNLIEKRLNKKCEFLA